MQSKRNNAHSDKEPSANCRRFFAVKNVIYSGNATGKDVNAREKIRKETGNQGKSA